MRTLDPYVVGIEVMCLPPLDAMPLEAFQELLGEREVAVVGVEYVNIVGTQPGTLPHLSCEAGDGLLMLIQSRHGAPAPAVLLCVVKDVHRLLPQVPGTLSGGEDEGRAGIYRPVAIVDHQRFLDYATVQVVLHCELIGFVHSVESPRRHQAVSAQAQTERSQSVMGLAVLLAILLEDHQVVEHRAALIAPRNCKCAVSVGLIADILRVVMPVPS